MSHNNLTKINKIISTTLFILILCIFSSLVARSAFASHNQLHIGECPEGQVEIPNGTCGPSTTLLIPTLTEPTQTIDADYTLLQKIGSFDKFNSKEECALVRYMDAIIKIFIGIAAVLAMIMIIAGGIQYMTTDSVAHHKEGMQKLQNALLGLLIALGAWIILNTINPNLLNFCLSKQLPDAVITLEDEYESAPDSGGQDGGFAPNGPVGRCKEGIIQLSSPGGSFFSCKTIAFSVLKMITAAWNNKDDSGKSDPIKLSMFGFRTREKQIELRALHCGGPTHYNIYEKSSRSCNPPTARPGTSRHEVGMAFDIACEGKTIKSRDNKCFRWLAAHAHEYKLFNLPVEPWHWSVDGK